MHRDAVMTHAPKSVAPRNIARAIIAKAGDLFFISEQNGGLPAKNQDGFGLYYHDCRYLDGYGIRFAGTRVTVLLATAAQGPVAEFELTNKELQTTEGRTIPARTFGIHLKRLIDAGQLVVHDLVTIHNYGAEAYELPLSFAFDSRFEDIFEIRGLNPKKIGKEQKPEWHAGILLLNYSGADGVFRRTEVHFEPAPHKTGVTSAEYQVSLQPGERQQLKICFRLVESRENPTVGENFKSNPDDVIHKIDRASRKWLSEYAELSSDDEQLNRIMRRSLLDLGILRSELDGYSFFSAGLPWYGALFGRDSLIAALQSLAYESTVAESTIRLLAKYQGKNNDDWRDEEPGKILHELRRGELANLNRIPQTPYYGSVDSTPLFLILVGEHANWTGELALFNEIRPHVERALEWIDQLGADRCQTYLSYASKSSKGIGNQGWKDSGDGVINADGSPASPPIALVEVQGYVYYAKLLIADLYERAGDIQAATRLRNQATSLYNSFNRDFWIESKKFYAMALEKGGRPAAVISSNPGQALWTGIVDTQRAQAVVDRLVAEDMFTGWGIRTLSKNERRYNPIGYHLGTVWPHDNSIMVAGFRRYGFDAQAVTILESMVRAAHYFEHERLPELFGGFSRHDFGIPVRYPVACHPQAWAAGAVPFMMSSLLGLAADAFHRRLRVVRPALPAFVDELDFRRLKIGDSTIDLHFERTTRGDIRVEVTVNNGSITVEVE